MNSGPLSRFRVLDLTRMRSGPAAVRHFADWGAQITMVEQKSDADSFLWSRHGGDFQNLNRNKRSLSLDLKRPEGLEIFMKLAREADVLFENFRPSVKSRLGIDYETLSKINPGLVYVSISGFGQDGPYSDRPGFDQVAQGMGGLMAVTGEPGRGPMRAGYAVTDTTSGLYGALGALTALLDREATGKGSWVRTSLLQAAVATLDFQAVRWTVDGIEPQQEGNFHPLAAPMGLFETSDGYVNIAVGGGNQFENFCEIAGLDGVVEQFAEGKRRTHRDELNRLVAVAMKKQPSAYWVDSLNRVGVPCGPVNNMQQVFSDPQVRHLRMTRTVEHPEAGELELVGQPIEISGHEPELWRAAPDLGQDSREILLELGLEPAEIDALVEKEIVA